MAELPVIVSGGYRALECAEQLIGRGVRVAVVEAAGQAMASPDPGMTRPIMQALENAGLRRRTGDHRRDGAARAHADSDRPRFGAVEPGGTGGGTGA